MREEEPPPIEGTPVEVPHDALAAETLRRVIEEFVTREGTDYGRDVTLEDKVRDVRQQLQRGSAVIVFDPSTEGVTILVKAPPARRPR